MSGPINFCEPVPVSISTSLSPVLSTSVFCSSLTLSVGQEIVGQRLAEFFLADALEDVRLRRAEIERAVGHHGRLDGADLEPVEVRRLGVEQRRLGQGRRCNGGKAGRKASDDIAAGYQMGAWLSLLEKVESIDR